MAPAWRALTAAGAALLAASWCACSAPEPVRRSAPQPLRPSAAEQAGLAERASRPGPDHKRLDALCGEWRTRLSVLRSDGTEEPSLPGEASIRWVLGGRYLRWDARVELPGGAHAGTGFLGHSAAEQEYQWLMISDLATGMGVARGRGDLAGTGMRFVLEVSDRQAGVVRRQVSLLRLLGPDQFVHEVLAEDASGRERASVRTLYQRAAPRP